MTEFFRAYPWVAYLLIFLLTSYVYNKVFRQRKLPILKTAVIYMLLAFGSVMLLFFQLAGLPIIPSLSIAVILMLMVRIRYFVQEREKNKESQQTSDRS
ncbi:YlaH-like family protein [Paenibacillus sp. YYML68]|uniref:YlaH-like family protein n=1 Tax=Paenibacillus sp. YYML68 TaxID=2909250 RepID=UPI0024931CA1|nr:YlaH-like family protein [Paenibacillus sp. YYML68]